MSQNDVWKMAGQLHRDCEKAGDDLARDDTPYNRRTYVRTTFSALESAVFLMKQTAMHHSALLTGDEISKCLDEKGPYPPLAKSVEFAVEVFSKAIASPFRLGKRDDWNAFLTATRVRNGISHPKRLESLSISDEQIQHVGIAYRMVVRAMLYSVVQASDALHQEVKELCEKHGA